MTNEIPHSELPEPGRYLQHWEMSEAQIEIVNLASALRGYGVEVRFESDELPGAAIRFMRRLNGFISLMDGHAFEAVAIPEDRAA